MQRHPLRGDLEHVDLLIVKKGEKVIVEVPLVIVGEERLAEGMVMSDMQTITLEAEATNIPAHLEIDVASFQIGHQVTVADLDMPEGAAYPGDTEDLVLTINVIRAEVEPETDEEAAAEGETEAAAEGDSE